MRCVWLVDLAGTRGRRHRGRAPRCTSMLLPSRSCCGANSPSVSVSTALPSFRMTLRRFPSTAYLGCPLFAGSVVRINRSVPRTGLFCQVSSVASSTRLVLDRSLHDIWLSEISTNVPEVSTEALSYPGTGCFNPCPPSLGGRPRVMRAQCIPAGRLREGREGRTLDPSRRDRHTAR